MTSNLVIKPVQVPVPAPARPAHILGDVADDWHAIEVWLQTVAANSRNGKTTTVDTYRFHLAKLRWFCDNVLGRPPSTWSMQDVEAFRQFLSNVPKQLLPVQGVPNHTPFRTQPSPSAQSDIMRFTKSMFSALHRSGYLSLDPMALIRAPAARELDVSRALRIDVFETVLQVMDAQDHEALSDRRRHLRDRFILVCLRELGLRASELVGATMGAFKPLSDPQSRATYWVFDVDRRNAKGAKERGLPVTSVLMDALVTYRLAFGLTPYPAHGDASPLLLSPRTRKLELRNGAVRRTADKRFFGAWRSVRTRQGLHKIVKARLEEAAGVLDRTGELETAERLRQASAHWLRHTFATAAVLKGQDIRVVAKLLGHRSVETTMRYTKQETLDLVRAAEKLDPGTLAKVGWPLPDSE